MNECPPSLITSCFFLQLHDNGDLEVNPVTAEFHNPWDGAGLTCKAIGLSGATVTVAPWIYVLTSDVAES